MGEQYHRVRGTHQQAREDRHLRDREQDAGLQEEEVRHTEGGAGSITVHETKGRSAGSPGDRRDVPTLVKLRLG